MAVKDSFIISDNTAKAVGKGLAGGGIIGRMFLYFLMYLLLTITFAIFISDSGENTILNYFISSSMLDLKFKSHNIFIFAKILIYFILPAIPFILFDWIIRMSRRKRGLSPWRNIEEELKQRDVDERVARERKAHERLEGEEKIKDLDYWFGMLSKGAITETEYEAKKREFM